MSNEVVKTGEKILKPVLHPYIQTILKPVREAKKLPSVAIQKSQAVLRKFLATRENSLKSYVSIGRYYVSKRLLAIIFIVILVLVYFLFIKPPAFLNKWLGKVPTIQASAPKATSFTGKAKVVDDAKLPKYSGELVDGLYAGQGKLYNDNGMLVYEGQFDKGLKSGTGTLFDDNGNIAYNGQFAAGVFNGTGMLYFQGEGRKIRYEGEFQNGTPGGAGKEYYPTGELKYEGSFSADTYSGDGKLFYSGGKIRYEGGFQASQFSGSGKLFNEQGAVLYEGSFVNGKYAGEGVEYYPNGFVKYKGSFTGGSYHGEGESFSEKGVPAYKGTFANGAYNGSGERYDEEGSLLYKGSFKNNAYEGLGTVFDKDGAAVVKSFFSNGKLNLQGFIGLSSQKIEELLGKPTELLLADSASAAVAGAGTGGIIPENAGSAAVETADNNASAAPAAKTDNKVIVGLPAAEPAKNQNASSQPDAKTVTAGNESAAAGTDDAPVTPDAEADGPVKLRMSYTNLQMAFVLETSESNPKEAVVTDISLWSSKAIALVQPDVETFKDIQKPNELGYIVMELKKPVNAKSYSNSYFKDDALVKLTHMNGDKNAYQLDISAVPPKGNGE